MQRPFIFAYSAFTNIKVLEEVTKNGFDKLIDSPLNKLNVANKYEFFIELAQRLDPENELMDIAKNKVKHMTIIKTTLDKYNLPKKLDDIDE